MNIEIKIGRDVLTFTEDDVFIDNGACVQCRTQRGKHMGHGRYCNLVLTKKALKELESKCKRENIEMEKTRWNLGVQYFRYKEK